MVTKGILLMENCLENSVRGTATNAAPPQNRLESNIE